MIDAGNEPRASHMPDKCSVTELNSSHKFLMIQQSSKLLYKIICAIFLFVFVRFTATNSA